MEQGRISYIINSVKVYYIYVSHLLFSEGLPDGAGVSVVVFTIRLAGI